MEVHGGIDELPGGIGIVMTVGVFDGMHRGHAAVLRTTVETARESDARPVVVTFDPHPDALFHGSAPPLLCDPRERLERLAGAGIAHVVVERFDERFAAQSAFDFVERVRDARRLAAIVMSPDSAFGRGRDGTAPALSGLGARVGFRVVLVRPLWRGGAPVSASRIRALLGAGRLAEAALLLGRPHAVVGTVVVGDNRGRELGFPTANLSFEAPVALPPDGIYAARATWGGAALLAPLRSAGAVVSLGVRPTFGGGERRLEAHLLDVDETLYGQRLRVAFVRRQRGERRFRSVAGLVAQMHRDADRARLLLGEAARLDPGPAGATPATRPARPRR